MADMNKEIEVIARSRCKRRGVNPDRRPGTLVNALNRSLTFLEAEIGEVEKDISDFSAAGLVVVPREPTGDMSFAGGLVPLADIRIRKNTNDVCIGMDNAANIYKAMISGVEE